MSERLFTLEEAQELLPRVRPLLERSRDLSLRLAEGRAAGGLQGIAGGNGGGGAVQQLMEIGAALQAALEEIEALGIVVRDPATGLIDFPAERQGAPIFLCWRLGEEAIAFWHDTDSGFAGRQPLP